MSVVELLLSKGADINDKNNYGDSAIIEASAHGHVNVVKLLLCKGSSINGIDNDRKSAVSASNDDKIKHILRKWPMTMAILILKELGIYYQTDTRTLIDLYQYVGREDCTADNEEDYDIRGDDDNSSGSVSDDDKDEVEEEDEE